MGVSRIWDGGSSNYLQTDQGTSGGPFCAAAWIRPFVVQGPPMTIYGNVFGAGHGWRITSGGRLELFWDNGGPFTLSVPLLISDGAYRDWLKPFKDVYLAIQVTSGGGVTPVVADFYAGHQHNEVALIGSQTGGTFISTNGTQLLPIGGNNNGIPFSGAPIENPFIGAMKRVGRWAGTNLTLDELRIAARCGAPVPQDSNLSFFFEMTGASPEPNSGSLVSQSRADVRGNLGIGPDLCSEYPDVNISLRIGSLAVAPPPVFPPPPVYPPATPPAEDEGDVEQSPFACVDVI